MYNDVAGSFIHSLDNIVNGCLVSLQALGSLPHKAADQDEVL
jgi:hypothetical protein